MKKSVFTMMVVLYTVMIISLVIQIVKPWRPEIIQLPKTITAEIIQKAAPVISQTQPEYISLEKIIISDETPISTLRDGEEGYAVYYALWVDKEGHGWLNTTYHINKTRASKYDINVVKKGDGYIIYVPTVVRYTKTDKPTPSRPNEYAMPVYGLGSDAFWESIRVGS